VFAGWDGYPFETNTNSAYFMSEQKHFSGQLYTAVVERCEAFNVDLPEIVETWTVAWQTNLVSYTGIVARGFGAYDVNGFYVNNYTSPNVWSKYLEPEFRVPDAGGYGWYGYQLYDYGTGGLDIEYYTDDDWFFYYENVPVNSNGGSVFFYSSISPDRRGLDPIGKLYDYTNSYTETTYTNITTTNQIGSLTYTNGDAEVVTIDLPVTRNFLYTLDQKTAEIVPLSVCSNETALIYGSTNTINIADATGTLNPWFTNRLYYTEPGTTNATTNLLINLPINSMAGIGQRLGVGYYTNLVGYHFDQTTNTISFVTNGVFKWTRQPETVTQKVAIADAISGGESNSWTLRDIGTIETNFYNDSTLPVIRFLSLTNQAIGNITIEGSIFVYSNQTTTATSETVNVGTPISVTTNTDIYAPYTNYLYIAQTNLTLPWCSVTNISAPDPTGAPTGSVLSVYWEYQSPIYGDQPYTLYAADVDERIKVLNACVWSYRELRHTNPYKAQGNPSRPNPVESELWDIRGQTGYRIGASNFFATGTTPEYTALTQQTDYTGNDFDSVVGQSWNTSEPLESSGEWDDSTPFSFVITNKTTETRTRSVSNDLDAARRNYYDDELKWWRYELSYDISVTLSDYDLIPPAGSPNGTYNIEILGNVNSQTPTGYKADVLASKTGIAVDYSTFTTNITTYVGDDTGNPNVYYPAEDYYAYSVRVYLSSTAVTNITIDVTTTNAVCKAEADSRSHSYPMYSGSSATSNEELLTTNTEKEVDIYMLGGYPTYGTEVSYIPELSSTNPIVSWDETWVQGSSPNHPVALSETTSYNAGYLFTNSPTFQFVVPSYMGALTNLVNNGFRYIDTQSLIGNTNILYTGTISTNPPYFNQWDTTHESAGWSVRKSWGVLKWDFLYK